MSQTKKIVVVVVVVIGVVVVVVVHVVVVIPVVDSRNIPLKFSSNQCNTNFKFLTEYEYIRKRKYHRI